ncbi:hypothetical protein M3Y98_00103900 [Aphelenchoides besseyi]|nr:hypothetical protein M3Y98_00103900 [Aphelenchoides besseyi]KAI6194464.1 hypothetical protein M3Y96_01127700 [Aphelenchoides besseyi]
MHSLTYVLFLTVGLVVARQVQLPVFMQDTSVAAKAEFNSIIHHAELPPAERRKRIEQLIARQPVGVQQAYQQYQELVHQHQQKFGISLETELEKARQEYNSRG